MAEKMEEEMKNIIKATKSKGIPFQAIPILILICAMVICPKFAFAAASVSLTGGTWALGLKGASSESASTAGAWAVTNDSGGVEDVNIKVVSTLAWTASTDGTQAANQFVLRKDNSSGQIITGTDANLITSFADAGTSSFGLYFKAPPLTSEEGAHTLTVTLTATNWIKTFVCGDSIIIAHTATAGVAPVDKSVTYGTVLTSLSGASKCWITQNLGAAQQATSATDATEASAGWYWQFNRKQGYKHDGTTLTPAWTITAIDENITPWAADQDPCTLLLGTGWRLPTYTEYLNADATGGWINYNNDATGTFGSVLKLHAAGYLNNSTGPLFSRGSNGHYWSSTQSNSTNGYNLTFNSSSSSMNYNNKAYGFSVRCLI